MASGQVAAHRIARMVLAGPALSKRDRKEFQGMVTEKYAAFVNSWYAMTMRAFRANLEMSSTMMWLALTPIPLMRPSSPALVATQMHKAALDVLGQGLARVHRKAMSNAKRLATRS